MEFTNFAKDQVDHIVSKELIRSTFSKQYATFVKGCIKTENFKILQNNFSSDFRFLGDNFG